MPLRVREKILIITTVTFLLAIGANTLVISRMFRRGYSEALQSKMNVIANTVRSHIERLLGLGIAIENIEGFDVQCQEILNKHKEVAYVMVAKIDGKILFHNDPAYHGTRINDPHIYESLMRNRQTVCLHEVDEREYYNTIVPVGDGSSKPNVAIIVGFPTAFIDDKVQVLLSYSFIVALASLCIATFLLLTILSISVTRPLSSLVSTIQQIRDSSDLNRLVTVKSKDEIGELAISFNQMVEDLNKTTVSHDSLIKEVAERKQAEYALRKSEDRFKQVAENAGEWIWEVNAEGLYTYSSPIAEEILGYTTEEIVGKKHFYDFFAPDVKDELKKAAFEVFAKRESFRGFINPNIHKNGSTVILETNGTPVIDDRGNLCGYRGADRDITERKKAEERISHLNHLKEELLAPISIDEKLKDITDALVKIFDADFARIWMIKSGDLCNSGCIHADVKDGPHVCRHRDRCLHLMASSGRYTHIDGQVHRRVPFGCYKIGRVAAGTDTKFITNDVTHEQRVHNKEWAKKLGLVSFAGYRLISTEGVPVGVMALFSKHIISANDDTMLETIANTVSQVIQTTTAGEELRKTEEKYRIQFEGALDAIFVADAETGILIDCNPAGTKLVGREKSELIGQSHKILHPPKESDEEFAETFKQHLNEKRGQTLETQVITKTGEIKEVAIKANLLEIGGKKVLQGVFRDITERKQDQEELERTNEDLKKASRTAGMAEVATDVLHNVGNVLNSINVSVSFIEERVLDSKVANLKKVVDMIAEHANDLGTFLTEDQRGKHIPVYLTEATKLIDDEQAHITEKLQSLIKNVEHIKQIIQAQQRYARAGGVEVFTSINDIIKDAMEINSAGLKRHGVDFKLELSELPEFHMDKQRILQILVNLISNAKYALSKSEKQVRLLTVRSYGHAEGRLRIEVADNGMGISKENMVKIFIHGFTTRKEGHGFGLHSSSVAAKEMGGSLTVHSDGQGNGATFTLELPIKLKDVTNEH